MKKRHRKFVMLGGGLLVVLTLAVMVAGPVGGNAERVLDRITAVTEGDHYVLQLRFNVPVRYQDHFPQASGDVVQFKVRTIAFQDFPQREVIGREQLVRMMPEQVPLEEVHYEGGVPGGPFVVMRFSQSLEFKVREGAGLKELFITIPRDLPAHDRV